MVFSWFFMVFIHWAMIIFQWFSWWGRAAGQWDQSLAPGVGWSQGKLRSHRGCLILVISK
jgi:hypothetical protein